MMHLGTLEFVVEEDDEGTIVDCYFEQTEGEMDLVTITGFDSKPDEECEPVTVYYESADYAVGHLSSFGGMDTHVDAEPSGGVYESKLESPGGQQAAISLLHICGTLSSVFSTSSAAVIRSCRTDSGSDSGRDSSCADSAEDCSSRRLPGVVRWFHRLSVIKSMTRQCIQRPNHHVLSPTVCG